MDRENAKAWLRRFGDLPDDLRQQCKHGHPECSDVAGGACLDDIIKEAMPDVTPRGSVPS